MLDDRELEEYFSGEPKPQLRPFLATRVTAAAHQRRTRGLKVALILIWTTVLCACWIACEQVHLPHASAVAGVVLLLTTLPLRTRYGRRITLLLTGEIRPR